MSASTVTYLNALHVNADMYCICTRCGTPALIVRGCDLPRYWERRYDWKHGGRNFCPDCLRVTR